MNTPAPAPEAAWFRRQLIVLGLGGALLLAVFESTRLDLIVSRWAWDATAHAFPWQHHPFFSAFLHHGLKAASYALGMLALAVCALGWRGRLGWLPPRQALFAAAGMLLIPVLTSGLKQLTNRHCPWDILEFGGYAPYVSLFASTPADLVRGVCFPAGHAAAGLAWIVWGVALRATRPVAARRALIAALAGGLLLGAGRIAQGAHFVSHVLWSIWLAWALTVALAAALRVPQSAAAPERTGGRPAAAPA